MAEELKINIEDIKKVALNADDVIIYKLDYKNLPMHLRQKYALDVKDHLKDIFPNNKILVMSKENDLSVISKKDLQD